MTNEKKFDKNLWSEMKRAERENAYAMINETIFDIKEDITVLPKILEVMASFNKYSTANVLLIAHQKSNPPSFSTVMKLSMKVVTSKKVSEASSFLKKVKNIPSLMVQKAEDITLKNISTSHRQTSHRLKRAM